MADLVVGLAKSVVEGTLSKAQAAIEQEGRLRRSAQRDLVFITGEFQMMQSFLKVANAERVENPVVMTWVRQIRDLAYDVEDCIELVVHLDGDGKSGWWRRMVPSWTSWCVGPLAKPPLDEAVDEIEQLKTRVQDVSTRNTRYSLISDTGSKPTTALQQQEEQQPSGAGPAALSMLMAGAAGRMHEGDLAQLLAMKQQVGGGLRVISVWGTTTGDVGAASIIVWKAYTDEQICRNFTRRAWVKLTHPCLDPHAFVECLMDQFHANNAGKEEHQVMKKNIGLDVLRTGRNRRRSSEATTQDESYLQEVERQLDEESYLVVLEQVSTVTDWDTISKFFPPRKNKSSCIIVCTQQSQVATLSVGHPYHIMELNNHFSTHHSAVYAFYNEGSLCAGDKGKTTIICTEHPSTFKKKAAEQYLAENPLVGRDSELSDLRRCTIKACSESIQVMSVWGIASVGKSALVKTMFCNRVLTDCSQLQRNRGSLFDKYGWVDISHPFNLMDLARSLLFNFDSEYVDDSETTHRYLGTTNPILECQNILNSKRCLVVIDHLHSTKEWDSIQDHLVSGSLNNCIIAITSEASVARHCRGDKTGLVFNVKSLETDSSFLLFKNKVSATKYPLHPSLFGENAADLQELVSKCGGLPEVIVEIASSLGNKSVRQLDYARSLSNKFMHDLESNREFDSLQGLFGWIRTYFRICPDSLKPCIFYLSIFPRDDIIQRRRLVRRWIAEGYSRDNNEESAEHTGEKQFADLLDLSIIQQPPTALGGMRMVSCQVNGFIREYIVSRRMEENLVFELGSNCTLTTQRSGRHLVILKNWHRDIIVFESIDFSRVRSLTVFGKWESFFISQSMKLLRVLDLENASGIEYEDLEKMVKWLCRLKFLSLRGHREIQHLPWSRDHLRQLQTLDVRDTSILTLPDSIAKLQKLQYIRAGSTSTPASIPAIGLSSWFCRRSRLIGVLVPRAIGNLTALHTLGVVNIAASGEKALVKELKKLTQLRKLGVSGIKRNNSVKFFDAIKGHLHLESLSVHLDEDSKDCLDVIKQLPSDNMRSLKLYGLNDKLPDLISGLSKLAKVHLEMVTSMEENSIKLLGHLPQLCILRVKQQQGGELHFCVTENGEEDDSYQEVKVLEVTCTSSTLHLKFGAETMKKLEVLKIDCCNGSPPYQFSGLENLEALKEVLIVKGSTDAETLKQQFDRQLEDHPNEVKPGVKLVDH